MPFELDYTTGGVNYPASYWVIKFEHRNRVNQTGGIIFFGYADVASFDEFGDDAKIAEHSYTVTDPAIFDLYFGQASYPQPLDAFDTILEGMAGGLDDFFLFATQFSFVKPSAVEVGSQGSDAVLVTFPAEVKFQILGNFISGVTIKVNGSAVSILSVSHPSITELVYVIDTVADPDDDLTWEYDRASGFLADGGNSTMQSFSPQTATNTVGEYLRFDDGNNSGQLLLVG